MVGISNDLLAFDFDLAFSERLRQEKEKAKIESPNQATTGFNRRGEYEDGGVYMGSLMDFMKSGQASEMFGRFVEVEKKDEENN